MPRRCWILLGLLGLGGVGGLGCAAGAGEDDDPLLADDVGGALGGKADDGAAVHDVTPGIEWLSRRSEPELARLFAAGTATAIPLGHSRQQPLVGGHGGPGLLPLVQAIFEGTVWTADLDPDGAPIVLPGGDPAVTVTSVFVGHTAPYRGHATRSAIERLRPASGAAPPAGTIRPHLLSPYRQPIQIEAGGASVFVDYQADDTPILNRSIDEFREIDAAGCPGLFLVRTHYLASLRTQRWVYLFYIASDFGPAERACDLDRLLEPG
jgi:hypothetical protein